MIEHQVQSRRRTTKRRRGVQGWAGWRDETSASDFDSAVVAACAAHHRLEKEGAGIPQVRVTLLGEVLWASARHWDSRLLRLPEEKVRAELAQGWRTET